MDMIKEEVDLEERTVQTPPVEEEPLVDIQYEEQRDPLLPTALIKPETIFFDAIKLEPSLYLDSDSVDGIEPVDLTFPPASPDHVKSEATEEVIDFAAGGSEVISEEHACQIASHHIFTINQYRGSTTEHMLPQTLAGITEGEVSGIWEKESFCSINHPTDLQVYSAKKSLTNPGYKSRTRKRSFPCKECARVFSFKSSLERHILSHSEVKAFKCDNCGKEFSDRRGITKHLLTHKREKRYKCISCEKAYNNISGLRRHTHTHKEKNVSDVTYEENCYHNELEPEVSHLYTPELETFQLKQ